MLLERADVYAGVQAYPLFTMSRNPRASFRGGIGALSMDASSREFLGLVEPIGIEPMTSSLQS